MKLYIIQLNYFLNVNNCIMIVNATKFSLMNMIFRNDDKIF